MCRFKEIIFKQHDYTNIFSLLSNAKGSGVKYSCRLKTRVCFLGLRIFTPDSKTSVLFINKTIYWRSQRSHNGINQLLNPRKLKWLHCKSRFESNLNIYYKRFIKSKLTSRNPQSLRKLPNTYNFLIYMKIPFFMTLVSITTCIPKL